MFASQATKRIAVKNILFLTDFSESSANALPFASMVGRSYGSKVTALHVLLPSAHLKEERIAAVADNYDDLAKLEMGRVDAELAGLPHETKIERGNGVWPVLASELRENEVDLIVMGTHGRTGVKKALMGSSAEEVFRRTAVPVLTIGPAVCSSSHGGGRFRCILFATDFNDVSSVAAPYAISLAQENQSRLVLLHILPTPKPGRSANLESLSVAEAMHKLVDLVPQEGDLWCRPEPTVEHGEAGAEILAAASRCNADLIVLGVRSMEALNEPTARAKTPIAYDVVAHARCPVLTVRC